MTDILRMAWSSATSANPNMPATFKGSPKGQCAVTALLVQDLFGGDLLRTINEGESHYWNRLPDGTELDLTRGQFASWEPGEIVVRDRAYVLSHPDTARRYHLLLCRVASGVSATASDVAEASARNITTPAEAASAQHNCSMGAPS